MNILQRLGEAFEAVAKTDLETNSILGTCARYQSERLRYFNYPLRSERIKTEQPEILR